MDMMHSSPTQMLVLLCQFNPRIAHPIVDLLDLFGENNPKFLLKRKQKKKRKKKKKSIAELAILVLTKQGGSYRGKCFCL
jgi:hypothetical protein